MALDGWYPGIVFVVVLLARLDLAVGLEQVCQTTEHRSLDRGRYLATEELLQDLVHKNLTPGVVFGVTRKDETFVSSAGAYTEHSIFRICSMSKPLVSAVAMMLVEAGVLNLGTPVHNFLPGFENPKVIELCVGEEGEECGEEGYRLVPARRNITIEHLLTHRSGLTYRLYSYFGKTDPIWQIASRLYAEAGVLDGCKEQVEELSQEENVNRLAELPLVTHPGEESEYGLSTDVLGRVLELATGDSLDVLLRQRLLDPLGMNDTTFYLDPADTARVSRLAPIFHQDGVPAPAKCLESSSAPSWCRNAHTYFTNGPKRLLSGGCGLLSTVHDYLKFVRVLLAEGVSADGTRILSRRTVRAMTQENRLIEGDSPGRSFNRPRPAYGFGLGGVQVKLKVDANTLNGLQSYGWPGLHMTNFVVDPIEGYAGVILTQNHGFSQLSKKVNPLVFEQFFTLVTNLIV